MALRLSTGLHIASSLIADTPEKDKENAEPGDDGGANTVKRDGMPRSARKSFSRRRSSGIGGRRLSGFGGAQFDVNNAGKEAVDSMYSTIINLNTENKLIKKDCWRYQFIDHMEKMFDDDEKESGSASKVNFQKASCTIDASVKIYSHRVDSTHESSYSLLENLSRTDHDKARGGSGDAAVGDSAKSERIGVQSTLKKKEQLNLSNVDRAHAVDPMFQKMSKIFDEAGSKGMLLNNLCVSDGCQVSFDSDVSAVGTAPPSEDDDDSHRDDKHDRPVDDDKKGEGSLENDGGVGDIDSAGRATREEDGQERGAVNEEATAAASGGMVDVSGLRAKLFDICGDLSTLPLCPQLEEIREQIAEIENTDRDAAHGANFGSTNHADDEAGGDNDTDSDSDNEGGGVGFDDIPRDDGAASLLGGGGYGRADHVVDMKDDEAAFGDDADPFHGDNGESWGPATTPENGAGSGRLSFGGNGDGGASPGEGGMFMTGPASLQDRLCGDLKVVDDDYAFYDVAALASAAASNQWAGASHWKFVGRKRKTVRPKSCAVKIEDGHEDEEDGDAGGGRTARGKKKPAAIDFFNAPEPPESACLPPKRPTRASRGSKSKKATQDATLLSADYVKSRERAAKDGSITHTLPENAGFKMKDLGELFLRRGAFAKRGVAVDTAGRKGEQYSPGDLQGFHDSGNGMGCADGGGAGGLLFDSGDGGFGGGDAFDDDDDDDVGSEGFHFAPAFGVGEDAASRDGAFGAGVIGIGADGAIVDDYQAEGLISADRKVEKIQVNYARKAKRVDVRRLKGELWRKIDAAVVPKERSQDRSSTGSSQASTFDSGDFVDGQDGLETDGKEEDIEEQVPEEMEAPEVIDLTFGNIVYDVASQEEQMGVTVPFYFICVLHLANEKGLRLEGREDLRDFSVSSDPVPAGSH